MYALLLALVSISAAIQSGLSEIIPAHARGLVRTRREIEDDNVWDVSTECCTLTIPKDEKYDVYVNRSSECLEILQEEFNISSSKVEAILNCTEDYSTSVEEDDDNSIGNVSTCRNQISVCFYYCLLESYGVIGEDGKMVVKKVLEYSREDTPIQDENLWKEIEECATNSKSDDKYVCSSTAYDYLICAGEATDRYCPNELRSKDESCNEVEET